MQEEFTAYQKSGTKLQALSIKKMKKLGDKDFLEYGSDYRIPNN